MILVDVNVLVYAHRLDSPEHEKYHHWLERQMSSGVSLGISELALSAVVRIVTHPKIFGDPTSLKDALQYANELRSHPTNLVIAPGRRHWELFTDLCRASGARGNLVSDAYFAALAIEYGAEYITTDRDYARFPGLRWRHPLDTP